ncbi:MAG: response regulator [Cypionkella sp.]
MTRGPLEGRRILLVEDEYFQAIDAKRWLEEAGAEVVGPAGNSEAIGGCIAAADFDAAIVDINLGGGPDFGVADELRRRAVPMLFLTGYDRAQIPPEHAEVPCLNKPANAGDVIRTVERLLGTPRVR